MKIFFNQNSSYIYFVRTTDTSAKKYFTGRNFVLTAHFFCSKFKLLFEYIQPIKTLFNQNSAYIYFIRNTDVSAKKYLTGGNFVLNAHFYSKFTLLFEYIQTIKTLFNENSAYIYFIRNAEVVKTKLTGGDFVSTTHFHSKFKLLFEYKQPIKIIFKQNSSYIYFIRNTDACVKKFDGWKL